MQHVLQEVGELRYFRHPISGKKEDTTMNKYHQLTEQKRYAITGLKVAGHSQAQIAGALGRSRSTISREFARNRTPHDGFYRAEKAQGFAVAKRRPRPRGSPDKF